MLLPRVVAGTDSLLVPDHTGPIAEAPGRDHGYGLRQLRRRRPQEENTVWLGDLLDGEGAYVLERQGGVVRFYRVRTVYRVLITPRRVSIDNAERGRQIGGGPRLLCPGGGG